MKIYSVDLVKSKKAQLNTKINTVIVSVITIVILFQIFSTLVPEAQSAGDELGDLQRCSDAGGFYNNTQALCLNGTNPADTAQVTFSAIPISSLFGSSGVAVLLLMILLLMIVLKIIMPKRK
jgi:hypothetical protein